MRIAERHALKHLVLAVAVAGTLLVPMGCSKEPAANANKDMQKQQTNLMNAMDKIAADEAKKREAQSPSSPDAGTPIPAEKDDAPAPATQPPASAEKPPTQ